jgi:hypothetical protein
MTGREFPLMNINNVFNSMLKNPVGDSDLY